jgi:hypothetical protein
VPWHVARLVMLLVAPLVVDYSASRRLVVDYFVPAARPGASARAACHATRCAARRRLLRLAQSRRGLLRLRRSSGCLGTSRGSSRGSSRRLSSTTPPRHVAWLIACRRLLRLRRATGCLGTSRVSSRGLLRRSSSTTPPRAGSSSTTSPSPRVRVPRHVARLVSRIVARLVGGYFAYAARLGASARRATHRLSSTTSPTPRGLVPRHVAWLVAPLIVDYFAYAARPGASARHAAHRQLLRALRLVLRPRWLYFSHAVRRDYLSRGNTGSTLSTPCDATMSSSGRIASTIHLDYFSKLVENGRHAPNN